MDGVYCPNCDGILGGGRCQACGWTPTSAITRNESVFPFKKDRVYGHTTEKLEPGPVVQHQVLGIPMPYTHTITGEDLLKSMIQAAAKAAPPPFQPSGGKSTSKETHAVTEQTTPPAILPPVEPAPPIVPAKLHGKPEPWDSDVPKENPAVGLAKAPNATKLVQ